MSTSPWCEASPPKHVLCSECGQNLFAEVGGHKEEVMSFHVDRWISLHGFVGKMLQEVLEVFGARQDGLYALEPLWLIANTKRISQNKMYLCEKDGIDAKYVVEAGDEGSFRIHRYAHFTCNRSRLTAEGREHFHGMFSDAGFQQIACQPVSHGHFPPVTAMKTWPWYLVYTEVGPIRIGHQARITNINWVKATDRDLSPFFRDHYGTVTRVEVHADNDIQTVSFLERIRRALLPQNEMRKV